MYRATANGHLEILQWLFQHFPDDFQSHERDDVLVMSAFMSCNLGVIKLLELDTKVQWTWEHSRNAVIHGNATILEWL